ncbi:unnamed protein product, partial [Brenthis ino]
MLLILSVILITFIQTLHAIDWGCSSNDPVCGADGKSYNNICEFNNAKSEDGDLTILYEGRCLIGLTSYDGKKKQEPKDQDTLKSKYKALKKIPKQNLVQQIPVYAGDPEILFIFSKCFRKCRIDCPRQIIFVNKVIYFTPPCMRCCLSN